jgi:putative addiction module component (TIGR02574 family)
MSKAQILQALAQLSPAERREIVQRVRELDGNQWIDPAVSPQEQQLLDAELEDFARDPSPGSTWDQVQARIRQTPRS